MINYENCSIISFLSSIADKDGDTQKQKQEHRLLIYIAIAMSFGGLVWGSIACLNGLTMQSLFPYAYTFATILNFGYLYFTKNFKVAQTFQIAISLFIPFAFQLSLGGFIASGAVILWSILTILVSFTFQKKDLALRWFYLYIVLLILSGIFDHNFRQYALDISTDLSILFFTLNITMVSIIIFVLFFYFINGKEQLQKEVELLADTDLLTNIPNRRYFFEHAAHELARAKRNAQNFTLLMIDIDFFKSFNDEYGHDIGDEVLISFADFLHNSIREVDLVCRYGGEEFVILMPETNIENAQIFAQRIIKDCRTIKINSEVQVPKITISIGITHLTLEDENIEQIIKRSDIALYKAKTSGRDQFQIVLAPQDR